MEFDIEKMCRVCLKTNLESVLLFEEPKKIGGVSICDMISELTIYKVNRHDDFPHLICYECIERVENAYSFKKDFEQSHRKLVTYLDSINKFQAIADIKPIPTEEKSTQTIDSTLYPCEKCDQKFIKYERLREHRAIAHKGSANLCRICNKSFNRLAGLKSHISAAHPEIGYHNSSNQCYVCNKMFTRRDHVTRHIRNVHKIQTSDIAFAIETASIEKDGNPSSQILEEGECNADDVVKGELTPYIECLVCYKHFSSKNRLNRHMLTVHQLDSTHILKQEQNNEMETFENEVELLAEPEAYRNYSNEDDGEVSNDFDNEGGGDDGDDDDDEDGENDEVDNDDGLDSDEDGAINNTEFVAANSFIKCETEIAEMQTAQHEGTAEINEYGEAVRLARLEKMTFYKQETDVDLTSCLTLDDESVDVNKSQFPNEDDYSSELQQMIEEKNSIKEEQELSLSENFEKLPPIFGEEREQNPKHWERNMAKKARQAGQEYVNKKGNIVQARKLKDGCSERCRMKCKSKITEQERFDLFNEFWNIDSHEKKWKYLTRKVLSQPVKNQTTQWQSRRKESRTYNFRIGGKTIMVCKPMFLNTLGINDAWVRTALQKQGNNNILRPDFRGKNIKRRLHPELVSSVRQHISVFPTVPSPYYHKDTNREYLDESLDIRKMHGSYKTWMAENYPTQLNTANERQYRHIFNNDFNLHFIKPKKDPCEFVLRCRR